MEPKLVPSEMTSGPSPVRYLWAFKPATHAIHLPGQDIRERPESKKSLIRNFFVLGPQDHAQRGVV